MPQILSAVSDFLALNRTYPDRIIRQRSVVKSRKTKREVIQDIGSACVAVDVPFDTKTLTGSSESRLDYNVTPGDGHYTVTQDEWVNDRYSYAFLYPPVLILSLYLVLLTTARFTFLSPLIEFLSDGIVWIGLATFLIWTVSKLKLSNTTDPLMVDAQNSFYDFYSIKLKSILNTINLVSFFGLIFIFVTDSTFLELFITLLVFTTYFVLVVSLLYDGGKFIFSLLESVGVQRIQLYSLSREYFWYAFLFSFITVTGPVLSTYINNGNWLYITGINDLIKLDTSLEMQFLDASVSISTLLFIWILYRSDSPVEGYQQVVQRQSRKIYGRAVDIIALSLSSVLIFGGMLKSTEFLFNTVSMFDFYMLCAVIVVLVALLVLNVQIPFRQTLLIICVLLLFTQIIMFALTNTTPLELPIDFMPNMGMSMPLSMTIWSFLPFYFPIAIFYRKGRRKDAVDLVLDYGHTRSISVDGFTAQVMVISNDINDETYLNIPKYYATSIHDGEEFRILMTERFFSDDQISERSVAAVAAHEQGHIEHGDARLCEYIQKLSGVLMLGQNPLYEIFDFRKREIEADRYAVDTVGYEPYKEALDYLSLHPKLRKTGQDLGANMLPSFDSGASKEKFLSLFYLLFGDFAMAEAHPEVGKRKREMKNYAEDS